MPALVLLLVFTLYPTIFIYFLAVHDITVRTFRNPAFIGLENFIKVATNYEFWYALGFTTLFAFIVTPIEIAFGLLISLLLDRVLPGKRLIVTLILTPLAIAPALMGIMMKLMFNEFVGLIPYLLNKIGLHYSFFKDFPSSLLTLIITDVLQWTPFVFIVIYSGIQALPQEPYEAAIIDGADAKNIFRYITLPLLKPLLTVVLVLRLLDAFKTFDIIHVMTGGGPGFSTTTISVMIYKIGFIYGNFGLAAAATILLFYLATVGATIGLKLLAKVGVK
ncbi:MAG: sugar ABC transporter permease [Candidatus Methanomethylicaceae archaeon]